MKAEEEAVPAGPAAPPVPRADWAYFVDLDGTLLDIAPSPDEVHLDEAVQTLLTELSEFAGGAVALISGRSISDIAGLISEPCLPVAGQHGLERRDASGRVTAHQAESNGLALAAGALEREVKKYSGLLLEQKGLSLALHYRAVPELAGHVHTVMRRLCAELGPEYVLQEGKRVVELKPAGKDKGVAVQEFMQEPPFLGRTPVFLGDDATDEYAFAVVNEANGVSIKVGPGKTGARFRLKDVRAVRRWLDTR
ncbi:MAG: trehalose-phosphatase [Gemmatimonadaceae bacterium]